MRIFIVLIIGSLLSACASTPMTVYRDTAVNGAQTKKAVVVKVEEITPRVLSGSLAYRMGVRHNMDGYRKTSTLNPIFKRNSVLERYKYLENSGKWNRDYVDFLQNFTKSNAALDNEDISIFELKIIGINSGVETIVSKRFTGPVKRFNWVELFENKVPRDESGYLLTGTAYINYIPIFESPSSDSSPAEIEKEHKQYLVSIPMKIIPEKEYRDKTDEGAMYKEGGNLCLFGTHPRAPFAKIDYSKSHLMKNGAHIFSSASDFLQSIKIYSIRNRCDSYPDKAERDFFKNKIVKIGGSMYPHAYLLNKYFVIKNNLLNTKRSIKNAEEKSIKQVAMLLAYKDDSALHEINRTMSDARSALGELSYICKRRIYRTKKLSRALSSLSSKQRDRSYASNSYRFGEVKKRLSYYGNGISKATARFEALVAQPGGIQASIRSLEEYNTEVSMIPKSLNSAKVFCGQLASAVSELGSGSSTDAPSFMSMLGGVLKDSYRKSMNSKSGFSSSAPEPGTVESLDSMWSGFREANKKSMKAIRLSRLNQTKKNSEYLNTLQQVRDNYSRTGRITASRQKSNGTNKKLRQEAKQSSSYKGYSKVVLKKLPENKAGYDNKMAKQKKDDSFVCGAMTPIDPKAGKGTAYTTPVFTSTGPDAISNITTKAGKYQVNKCGNRYIIGWNGQPSIYGGARTTYNDKNMTYESKPDTFYCGCKYTDSRRPSAGTNSGSGRAM